LVEPNGYLFVSGIDTDIRTKVASDLGWKPLPDLLEEIHEGEPYMRSIWPCHYAGLEPLNKRGNWKIRYAAGFQLAPNSNGVTSRAGTIVENEMVAAGSSPLLGGVDDNANKRRVSPGAHSGS
jgi:hypothetical protein